MYTFSNICELCHFVYFPYLGIPLFFSGLVPDRPQNFLLLLLSAEDAVGALEDSCATAARIVGDGVAHVHGVDRAL